MERLEKEFCKLSRRVWAEEVWEEERGNRVVEPWGEAVHPAPAIHPSSFLNVLPSSYFKSGRSWIISAQVPPGPSSSCAQKLSKKDTGVRFFSGPTIHLLYFWPLGSLVSMHSSEETGKGIHFNAPFIVVPIL